MAESLINSIARLRVIEKRLLTREAVSRLAAAKDYEECLKILSESGYGMKSDPDEPDRAEAMIRAELGEAYSVTEELMPKHFAPVLEVFRMRHDITNIKLLYKLRLLGAELDKAELGFGGIYDGDKLKAAVKKGDYSMLPKTIAAALEELDVDTYRSADPQAVSVKLDGAYMKYAMGLKNQFVKKYFSALADFTNLIAILRDVPDERLLPAGDYSAAELKRFREALSDSKEKAAALLKSPLEISEVKERIRAAFSEYLKTGAVAPVEKARDEYLIGLASGNRSDIDSPAPIVGYLLAREREAEVVRLILTAKRSGIPASVIEERSMALYG